MVREAETERGTRQEVREAHSVVFKGPREEDVGLFSSVQTVNLIRIARAVSSSRRTSVETILDEVQKNCPAGVRADVGKFLGAGYYGEAYEVDGGDRVLKISIAKNEAEAKSILDRVRAIDSLGSDAFVKVYDYGILCDINLPGSRYMTKSGTAYFYIMEKLLPLSSDEKKIAVRTLMDLDDMSVKPDYSRERKKYMFSKGRQYRRDGDIGETGSDPLLKSADLFDRMRASGAGHRDKHGDNIMQSLDGQYKMIDLEQAKLLKT